jgi:alpha-L-rhamnosidase
LAAETPDLWDSGEVVSSDSLNIPYDGKPLASRQACHWRIRVWADSDGSPGPWSTIAKWEMGLLKADEWKAKWIRSADQKPTEPCAAVDHWLALAGNSIDKQGKPSTVGRERLQKVLPATWFRKSLEISKPVAKARLYSTAAGYVEVFLDGKRISDRVMNPAQTDFEKRILYDVDAVEALLEPGGHTLSAHLGEGFYGQNVAFNPKFRYGKPLLIMQLEITYQDGSTETVVTDDSWLTHGSPVIKNNVYAGEVFDARLNTQKWSGPLTQQELMTWSPATESKTNPTQRLESQLLPAVTSVREIVPIAIFNPQPDVWVFDFGQNFTGVPTLNLSDISLPAGNAINLRYSEWADDEGNIDQLSDGAFATTVHQVDCYISDGKANQSWTPSFTWHGFRYVEVTGLTEQPSRELLTGHLVRSGVSVRGTFKSSDAHLNRVHETALWTYESNLVSIPSDCPIRERCGWTGDAHATVTMSNCNFDMAAFWEKYLDDFGTSPHVSPSIIPGKRTSNSTPDWAVAQVLIAWEHYLNYGDEQTLRSHYPRLQEFIKHFHSLQKDGIIPVGYGDWCDPVRVPGTPRVGGAGKPQWTTPAITTTALFVHASQIMGRIASVLDDHDQAECYQTWSQASAEAFHQKFFDANTRTYGSQTADSMALSFGIVPTEMRNAVANSLNEDVLKNWNGHASVGALGHRWLYPALADAGYGNTALGTFQAKGHPGFHYLFDDLRGTSLWERKGAFDPATMQAPDRSLSHPFQGGFDAWFFQGLGGIRPDWEQPGYAHFFLQPVFPTGLDWVQVDLESPYGLIKSHWKREDAAVVWKITVPPNTTATTVLSGASLDNQLLTPGEHELRIPGENE